MTTTMKILFKHLGLNEKEMNTFLTMLEYGAQPVSVIAKHVGLPRSSMYLILEKLKKLGFVEEFERADIKYVKCIPVKNIADVLRTKERRVHQTLEELEEKLPELETLENKLSITPKVKFFEGKKAVMKMYENVLKEKRFYAFFHPHFVKKIMPEYHFKIPEMLRKNKGKAMELLVSCPEAVEYQKRFHSFSHKIKVLPKAVVFASDTIICSNKIYLISYGEKEVSATEIINASLAKTQRVLFEQLWKMC
jgi:sugar-specific transcriptional regulator TrmB